MQMLLFFRYREDKLASLHKNALGRVVEIYLPMICTLHLLLSARACNHSSDGACALWWPFGTMASSTSRTTSDPRIKRARLMMGPWRRGVLLLECVCIAGLEPEINVFPSRLRLPTAVLSARR